jgi:hypothetical protein
MERRKPVLADIIEKCANNENREYANLIKDLKNNKDPNIENRKLLAEALAEVVCNGKFKNLKLTSVEIESAISNSELKDEYKEDQKLYLEGETLLLDIFGRDLGVIEEKRLQDDLDKNLDKKSYEALTEIIDPDEFLKSESENKDIKIKKSWLAQKWNKIWDKISGRAKAQKESRLKSESEIKDIERVGVNKNDIALDERIDKAQKKLQEENSGPLPSTLAEFMFGNIDAWKYNSPAGRVLTDSQTKKQNRHETKLKISQKLEQGFSEMKKEMGYINQGSEVIKSVILQNESSVESGNNPVKVEQRTTGFLEKSGITSKLIKGFAKKEKDKEKEKNSSNVLGRQ